MTAAALLALRTAATLVDVAPSLRIRLRDGANYLTVGDPARTDTSLGIDQISPSRFRCAVGRLYRQSATELASEHHVRVHCHHFAIDVGLRPGDRIHPGDIYQIRTASERWLYLFVTELSAGACRDAVETALASDGENPHCPDSRSPSVGYHVDSVTDLTVVHVMSPLEGPDGTVSQMCRLLEVCAVGEVIEGMEVCRPSAASDVTPT